MKKIVKSTGEQVQALVELTADEKLGVIGGADEDGYPRCGNDLHPGPWPNWSSMSVAQQVVIPSVVGLRR